METATPGTTNAPLVLTIEDDPTVRQFLFMTLKAHGYRVAEALTGANGITQAAAQPPDIVLLDMGLPDTDGLDVTRRLREWTTIPIIVISGQRHEAAKVAALDAGADDYITKPFGVEELLARIRVALRHAERAAESAGQPHFLSGDLHIDYVRRQVTVRGEEIRLTPTEYRLLTTLARGAGRVLTHRELLKEVWGPEYARESNYLRVYMKHLRDKIEVDPAHPVYLLSEPGVGYRLAVASG